MLSIIYLIICFGQIINTKGLQFVHNVDGDRSFFLSSLQGDVVICAEAVQ